MPQRIRHLKGREGDAANVILTADPPCIRHLPFFIAGDRQSLPLRVRAPHLFAWRISKCMGLILRFCSPAGMNVDMLHGHLLLALAAMSVGNSNPLPSRFPIGATSGAPCAVSASPRMP
jgi:hypothetical protein